MTVVRRWPNSSKKTRTTSQIGPRDSNARGQEIVEVNALYFSDFLMAAASSPARALMEVFVRYE